MKKLMIAMLLLVVLAGCGKSDSKKESEASGRGTVTCEGSAISGETGLPSDFPSIEGITFVKSEKTGPTQIVDGYVNQGLEDVYDEFNREFKSAAYEILFHEIEEDDAEVSYRRTEDEGGDAIEGQVALRTCDEDKTSVHITARPT